MADPVGNVFDNSAVITPSIDGQVTPPAGNEPVTPATTPAPATAPVEPGQVAPAAPAAPVTPNWQSEFKTPDEMYAALTETKKSYENLRPAYTRATTELSTLRKGAQTPVTPPLASQPLDASQAIIDKVVSIVAPIQERQETLGMQNTLAVLATNNKDFNEVMPIVAEIFKEKPALWNIENPVETVYELAQARYIKKNISTIAGNAASQVYADKQLGAIAGDARTPVNTPAATLSPEDEVKAGILGAAGKRNSIF